MARRKPVLFLLSVTVVAPIVLAITPGFVANSHFGDEIPILSSRNDVETLNALSQESVDAVKEPTWAVYPENSSNSDHVSAKSSNGVDASTTTEMPLGQSGQHKSRVLSEDSEGTNLQTKTVIQHVTKSESKDDGLQKPEMGRENKATAFKKSTFATESGEQDHQKPEKGSNIDSGDMPDAKIRQFRDQLIRAKVFLSLPSSKTYPEFIRDLRVQMRDTERTLGDATLDSELPKNAREKLKAMEQTLLKGKQIQEDCSAVVEKLRASYQSAEEQVRVQKKQELFLTQVAAKTLPRGLHCLSLHLTTQYYSLDSSQQQFQHQERLEDPKLYHYALFSDNVLATAVVVNSTVFHAKNPKNHVFHVVTDRLNYAAMKMWFLANPPGNAAIQVQNVEEFTWLNSSYSPVLKQLGSQSMIDFYFRLHHAKSDGNLKFRNPKYLSILNHLRFYLPEILPKLSKVVFLDDDVVVQKDLTSLWTIDLKGKVNGAVETCGESFHRFDRYLNFSNPLIAENFDPHACGWAFGMNVFDLDEWRKQNITDIYHHWQTLNEDRLLWKLGTLPPGLITFWKRTYPLDRSWHVLGLGYNPNVNQQDIEGAAAVHYNGNMKPWLEIGMAKYHNYWSKYVNYDQVYLRDCSINP
ncbi:probable galacturonosyltransferase 4 [Musa acuminata AAA Group]|uniref:probable galacturonosyltransferase 4 n=1 Tax=Musa acuminata AAA Group TaxID=214697 RepID=UPI0031D55D0A